MVLNKCISANHYALLFLMVFISPVSSAQKTYSPYVTTQYPMNVYWGDTHLHTNLSTETYAAGYEYGNERLSSDEAYRAARGETVKSINDMPVRLRRPLDFLMIADHAESFGVAGALDKGNRLLLQTAIGEEWYQRLQAAKPEHKKVSSLLMKLHLEIDKEIVNSTFRQSVWDKAVDLAEYYNDPGTFTTLIGFEWSSRRPYYIHRTVIFKDGPEKVKKVIPYSSWEGNDPEQLWDYMENYHQNTGGDVLGIPHNANFSQGKTFMEADFQGRPFSSDYAKVRSRWEPLFEITQSKGTSESYPALSPGDEFSDHEILSWRAEDESMTEYLDKKRHEYARPALKLGLRQKAQLGVNPFKFGFIGSTDGHLAVPVVEENNFWGGHPWERPYPGRVTADFFDFGMTAGEFFSASGYAAVWATENTREEIFNAMKRKEVYATTGPRMTVRFFGGWDYSEDDALKPDLENIGYSKGVPMGGDLTNAPRNKAPRFLVRAIKDPDGANLDRVQVIKGWLSVDGELHEKIYNVALSENRRENDVGKVVPVGSTVNVDEASYSNSIGDQELAVVWTDPDFNRNELAFYYLRVLEIPTPRWTAYDATFFKIKDIPKEIPMVTQERAYTSPIWYSPK